MAALASCPLSPCTCRIPSDHRRADALRRPGIRVAANGVANHTRRDRSLRAAAFVQALGQDAQKAIITPRGFLSSRGSLFAMPHTSHHCS